MKYFLKQGQETFKCKYLIFANSVLRNMSIFQNNAFKTEICFYETLMMMDDLNM